MLDCLRTVLDTIVSNFNWQSGSLRRAMKAFLNIYMKQKTFIAVIAALCLLSSVGPIQVFAESGSGSSNNGSDDSSYDDNENEDDSDDADDSDEDDDSDSDDDSESEDESEEDDDNSENSGPQKRPWFSPLRSGILEEKRDERREAIKAKLFEEKPTTTSVRFNEPVKGPAMHLAAQAEMIAAKIALFHARLANIMIRIQTNIDAAEKDGKDASEAQKHLDEAKNDLKDAQELMADVAQARADARIDIEAELEDSTTEKPIRDIVKPIVDELKPEIKSDMEKIRDLMKSAHLHMITSITILKSL